MEAFLPSVPGVLTRLMDAALSAFPARYCYGAGSYREQVFLPVSQKLLDVGDFRRY